MKVTLLQSLFSNNELILPGEMLTVREEIGRAYIEQGIATAVVKKPAAVHKPEVSQPSVPPANTNNEQEG